MLARRLGVVTAILIFCVSFLALKSPAGSSQDSAKSQSATPDQTAKAALAVIHGELRAPGLQDQVEVLRDTWGVPHIYATNQHDLFFAQGFVAAQDRLFQMEMWKRAGQGRLAEVAGETMLSRDVSARLLRYRGDMAAEYKSYSGDAQQILSAFTDGINEYIKSIQQPGGPGLPVEFQIAGFAPEVWKPRDCLSRMPTLAVSGNATSELENAKLVALIGAEKAGLLRDFSPPTTLDPVTGLDLQALKSADLEGLHGTDTRISFPSPLEGSNNWTISGTMTATGKPLLANDPHRTIAIPSLRYIVHLVAPGWNVIGATEPGIPGVAVGHNENIAWGFTVFPVDQEDLYLEELNPADPLEYKTPHGWKKMRVEEEAIVIRGKAPQQTKLKFTEHGPVLWEDGKHALALHWIGVEPGTVPYLASLSVDRAKNWSEFLGSMERWKSPPENIVYADRAGNIGEQSAGLTPIRKGWNGLMPVPGASGLNWAGFIALEKLPRQFNPLAGFYATANNETIPANYPYDVGHSWSETRVSRINEVLKAAHDAGKKLSIKDLEDLQNDVTSLSAQDLIAVLREVSPSGGPGADIFATAKKMLLDWNQRLDSDSGAAALFEVWEKILSKQMVLGILHGQNGDDVEIAHMAMMRELKNPTADVFSPYVRGIDGTKSTERALSAKQLRDAAISSSLTEAYDTLGKLLGANSEKWTWGGLHHMELHHPLEKYSAWTAILNPAPVPRPGDGETVDATGGEGYLQTHGASFREILDVADWDRSVAINVPGESGQPASPHYADLLPLWARGEYFPLLFSRKSIEQISGDRLVLNPK